MKDLAELSPFFVHQPDNHSRAVGPGMSSRSRRLKHPMLQLTTDSSIPLYCRSVIVEALSPGDRQTRNFVDAPAARASRSPATTQPPCQFGRTSIRRRRPPESARLMPISCYKCQACLQHVPVEDMPSGPNVLDRYTSPSQRVPALAVTLASEPSLAQAAGACPQPPMPLRRSTSTKSPLWSRSPECWRSPRKRSAVSDVNGRYQS
jgi:hypothetical protein